MRGQRRPSCLGGRRCGHWGTTGPMTVPHGVRALLGRSRSARSCRQPERGETHPMKRAHWARSWLPRRSPRSPRRSRAGRLRTAPGQSGQARTSPGTLYNHNGVGRIDAALANSAGSAAIFIPTVSWSACTKGGTPVSGAKCGIEVTFPASGGRCTSRNPVRAPHAFAPLHRAGSVRDHGGRPSFRQFRHRGFRRRREVTRPGDRDYLVLGPIEVRHDGAVVDIGFPKQRAVLMRCSSHRVRLSPTTGSSTPACCR